MTGCERGVDAAPPYADNSDEEGALFSDSLFAEGAEGVEVRFHKTEPKMLSPQKLG